MMKFVFAMALLLGGFGALPASAQSLGWIKTCGDPDVNLFGTSECPAKEVGEALQATTAAEFRELAGVLDTDALAVALRMIGEVVSNRAASSACREDDFMLLLEASEIWNGRLDLSSSANRSQVRLFENLGFFADNAAIFVSEGC